MYNIKHLTKYNFSYILHNILCRLLAANLSYVHAPTHMHTQLISYLQLFCSAKHSNLDRMRIKYHILHSRQSQISKKQEVFRLIIAS